MTGKNIDEKECFGKKKIFDLVINCKKKLTLWKANL
jgi:hypothetical protein